MLPGRNFARFILMLYILFCLVVRTAYQGKQFEFMSKEMRRPDVKTLDEFIRENFTLFVNSKNIEEYVSMEFIKRLLLSVRVPLNVFPLNNLFSILECM